MYELSLFSGAGGVLLATKWLLGWTCVGYVEIDDYCQRVLAQRIKDGLLDNAPIYSDIKTFINEGYAEMYRGVVDIVTAGFPCQPFSVANRNNKEEKYKKNLWPETIASICKIRPKAAFLENVPALLVHEYARRIFGDLAEAGYNAQWTVLGGYASDSCCEGERLWIVAIKANGTMLESLDLSENRFTCKEKPCRRQYTRAISKMLSQDDYTRVKRDSNAVARAMDRLKAIGNGQVPAVAASAWKILNGIGINGNYHT